MRPPAPPAPRTRLRLALLALLVAAGLSPAAAPSGTPSAQRHSSTPQVALTATTSTSDSPDGSQWS